MPRLNLPDSSFRLFLPLLLITLLSSCASGSIKSSAMKIISAVSSYKSALHYYEAGDIMLARRAAMRTDASRPDYQQAQDLLKKKIEPARRRLLRHYRLAAVKAERRGTLYIAKQNYLKAAELSIGGTRMQRNADRVDLVLRQKRIDRLSKQRRKEDDQLLDTLRRYSPPSGLNPRDKPFIRELDRAQDLVLARGRTAWNAAKRELREGHPEVAYVEAESYMHLRPGSRRGPLLMQEVKEALPKGLRLPNKARSGRGRTSEAPTKTVNAEQIRKLMQEGKWLEARDYAMLYRRDGGDDAEVLLRDIDKNLKKQAEAAFRVGQVAFQNEQLDKAVKAWSRATELQPDNRDYSDSLRRASELQESFRILQGKGSNGD